MQTQWDNKTILFFDGNCGFCNFWVNFLLKRDKKQVFLFSPLESELGIKMREEFNVSSDVDSIVLIQNGKSSIKSEAVISICKLIGFPYNIMTIFSFLPLRFTNSIYNLVGKYRHNLLKKTVCTIHPDVEHRFIK